ncbi:MAG: hypothetical protein P9M15_06245, partial [Candidatus Electryoneaceae bacterium]|nr:hypothetical protein [Candidatus Electryoneaceae bacterium]
MNSIIPDNWDSKQAADKIMAGLVNITAAHVKGAHDAEFVCVGDRAFIVTEANDQQAGESPGWSWVYAVLTVVDLKTLAVEKQVLMAKSEQVFDNQTLPVGACFVPRIIRKDDTSLRCYFCSEQPDVRQSQTWFIDFDIKSFEFDNRIYPAKIKTAAGIHDMQTQYFYDDAVANGFIRGSQMHGLYLIDSFKIFDGHTYVAINNFPIGQNALA